MIGLDTNVLVRHLTGTGEGDEVARAGRLMRSLTVRSPGFVPLITLIETWWVLGAAFAVDTADRLDALESMLRVPTLVFERREAVRRAIDLTRRGADFADALIAATCADEQCPVVMTFDKRAAKRAGMTEIPATSA